MRDRQKLTQGWLFPLSTWRDMRRRLLCLSSLNESEYEATVDWFVAQGAEVAPVLRRALHGAVGIACGAATALYRLGSSHGVRSVLIRCNEEEWLCRCLQNGHIAELRALRRLGRGTVMAILLDALEAAEHDRDERACLESLIVALSALRILAIFEEETSIELLERTIRFGPDSLRGLCNSGHYAPTASMTAWLRLEAVARLLHEHRASSPELLIGALNDSDRTVAATAIDGLRLLGDRSALPHLQAIAFQHGHALATHARRAVEHIAGSKADSLVLMRAADEPIAPEELLRPTAPKVVLSEQPLVRPVTSTSYTGS